MQRVGELIYVRRNTARLPTRGGQRFVSGPIHAGSFGPGDMDNTFGPQVMFSKDPAGERNLPPSAGLQFFGHVRIDGDTGVMTVSLKDLEDATLYEVDLEPQI